MTFAEHLECARHLVKFGNMNGMKVVLPEPQTSPDLFDWLGKKGPRCADLYGGFC